ncbi:MAG: hypothetical protein ABIP85_20365 [Chthoniobacteraceae bacterium]
MGTPHVVVELAAEAGRAWEFSLCVNNAELEKRLIVSGEKREWQTIEFDLSAFAGQKVVFRLYQNFLNNSRPRPPSAAHWKSIIVKYNFSKCRRNQPRDEHPAQPPDSDESFTYQTASRPFARGLRPAARARCGDAACVEEWKGARESR